MWQNTGNDFFPQKLHIKACPYLQAKADVADFGNWRPIYEGLRRESGLDATHHPLSAVRRQTGFTAEVRSMLLCVLYVSCPFRVGV